MRKQIDDVLKRLNALRYFPTTGNGWDVCVAEHLGVLTDAVKVLLSERCTAKPDNVIEPVELEPKLSRARGELLEPNGLPDEILNSEYGTCGGDVFKIYKGKTYRWAYGSWGSGWVLCDKPAKFNKVVAWRAMIHLGFLAETAEVKEPKLAVLAAAGKKPASKVKVDFIETCAAALIACRPCKMVLNHRDACKVASYIEDRYPELRLWVSMYENPRSGKRVVWVSPAATRKAKPNATPLPTQLELVVDMAFSDGAFTYAYSEAEERLYRGKKNGRLGIYGPQGKRWMSSVYLFDIRHILTLSGYRKVSKAEAKKIVQELLKGAANEKT